jgi:hypothetical protein
VHSRPSPGQIGLAAGSDPVFSASFLLSENLVQKQRESDISSGGGLAFQQADAGQLSLPEGETTRKLQLVEQRYVRFFILELGTGRPGYLFRFLAEFFFDSVFVYKYLQRILSILPTNYWP